MNWTSHITSYRVDNNLLTAAKTTNIWIKLLYFVFNRFYLNTELTAYVADVLYNTQTNRS